MLVCPTKCYFIESISTGQQLHDAAWNFNNLCQVIDSMDYGVLGAITDNTATSQVPWKSLKVGCKGMIFYRYVSHGLYLLVKDVVAARKTKWHRKIMYRIIL
jgi:Protein of unknown function (DUF 659)